MPVPCPALWGCASVMQVALELGLQADRRPVGYWDSLEMLDAELDAFIAGEGDTLVSARA